MFYQTVIFSMPSASSSSSLSSVRPLTSLQVRLLLYVMMSEVQLILGSEDKHSQNSLHYFQTSLTPQHLPALEDPGAFPTPMRSTLSSQFWASQQLDVPDVNPTEPELVLSCSSRVSTLPNPTEHACDTLRVSCGHWS